MKKSLLAVGLTLAMVLTMATPAFAANTDTNKNADGTLVTAPGHPSYSGSNAQVAGESFNEATVTSADGAKWETVNDDDALAGAADAAADINVWAKVVDSGSKIYKVDLAWGPMKFEYNSANGQWNPATHAYDTAGGTAAWTVAYLDGTNNQVGITNHSNNAIDATFAYAMDGTNKFNEAKGANNVVGNFFDTVQKAKTAATVLAGTYDASGANLVPTAVADKLAGSKVSLPTADGYNSTPGDAAATNATNNVEVSHLGRYANVYFAFSGTPDAKKGTALDTFKKVGVITVTVTPNNEVPLNRPLWTAPAP